MYFLVDVETGGLDPGKHSLLTASFWLVDRQHLTVVDQFDIAVSSPEYTVTPKAMEINGIDLQAHHEAAIPRDGCRETIESHLKRWQDMATSIHGETKWGKQVLMPLGHAVDFDLRWLKTKFWDIRWDDYLDYHKLDTQVIAEFLRSVGFIPFDWSLSLKALTQKLEIPGHNAHTAYGDCYATLAVLKKFRCVVKPPVF